MKKKQEKRIKCPISIDGIDLTVQESIALRFQRPIQIANNLVDANWVDVAKCTEDFPHIDPQNMKNAMVNFLAYLLANDVKYGNEILNNVIDELTSHNLNEDIAGTSVEKWKDHLAFMQLFYYDMEKDETNA